MILLVSFPLTVQVYLVLLYFALLHSQILRFLQLKGLWQPCFEQVCWCHFSDSICSLHVSFSHFGNAQYFKLFYYICYGDLWPVIFDVTVVLVLGHHEPRPFRMASLAHKCCVCSDCSSDSLSPCRPPYSMRHNNIEIRLIYNPTMPS